MASVEASAAIEADTKHGAICPHCEAPALEGSSTEGVSRCRACGRSSLVGAHVASEATRPRRARERNPRRAPGEVPSWPAALGAIAATAIFYGLLEIGPAGRVAELFLERGWVPYVVTGVAAWALLLLLHRAVQLRREAGLLDHDWISSDPNERIAPESASDVLDRLLSNPRPFVASFLGRRLIRSLRHFESRRRVVEVVEFLSGESSADEGRVDASYALIRVFVWAVPTLGFIGTVIGIGSAVGGFSETLEAASSLDGMKESIGTVTGGLGVAFDTTLLALVLSILIMFPASAVQRTEENLLAEIDEYCADVLVRRLCDEERVTTANAPEATEATLEALAARLAAHLESNPRGRSG